LYFGAAEYPSWDTWYLHQDITYESVHAFYATADADEKDVILREREL
jgi:hypothetical protein